MTYLIEYHNGLGWCAVGHRSSLDQAEAEVALRSRLWHADSSAFRITVRMF